MEKDKAFGTEAQRYQRAKKKANIIRGFYIHRLCYCVVIPIIVTINLVYSPEFLWFFFPILGWGTGLAFHAMEAFDYNPFLGKNWEQKKIRELMEKEEQKRKMY